jgi:hypothetical protein
MGHDLTTSNVARQNVLNNQLAVSEIESHIAFKGLQFEGHPIFTKTQVAVILEVDERTIDRYLHSHGDELKKNGYQILKGKSLKKLKFSYVDDMNVADILDPKAALTSKKIVGIVKLTRFHR